MPSNYNVEWRALSIACVAALTGTFWGWILAEEGQVPWWTYFLVCGASVFLFTYLLLPLWEGNATKKEPPHATLSELSALRTVQEYRKDFLANVAHELKTSVFVVQGFLDLLQEEETLPEEPRKLIARAHQGMDQLACLVEDMLTTSLMEHGAIRMQPTCFDMRALCEQLLLDLYKHARQEKITLSLHAKKNPIFVHADKKYLQQVMRNLIHNAISYNVRKGSVDVHLQADKKQLHVSVKDTGIGIPKAEQIRIFERFYRIEKSRTKDQGGVGIGLALVKHILSAHQSQIELKSQERRGSSFTFSLPLTAPAPAKST